MVRRIANGAIWPNRRAPQLHPVRPDRVTTALAAAADLLPGSAVAMVTVVCMPMPATVAGRLSIHVVMLPASPCASAASPVLFLHPGPEHVGVLASVAKSAPSILIVEVAVVIAWFSRFDGRYYSCSWGRDTLEFR